MATLKSVLVGVLMAIVAALTWIGTSASVTEGDTLGLTTVAFDRRWLTMSAVGGFVVGVTEYRRRVRLRRS